MSVPTGTTLYADFEYLPTPNAPMPDYVAQVWIYEESNGIAGLQRFDGPADDTCHGMIAPDTFIM